MQKAVVFVDGENLVMRYQSMLRSGWTPRTQKYATTNGDVGVPIVKHVPNCFVWSPLTFQDVGLELIRIHYYTSVVGGDDVVNNVITEIARTPFAGRASMSSHLRLIPRVHKKPKQSNKTKVVDVDITMDIMRAALTMPIDMIVLLSGDGDYVPLIREVVRSTSKQVWLAAFSDGLAPALRTCAEQFASLDEDFFEPRPNVRRFILKRKSPSDSEDAKDPTVESDAAGDGDAEAEEPPAT